MLGAARACLEIALGYTPERHQFSSAIAAKQPMQGELADVASEVIAKHFVAAA